jgi:hypothetical protein
MFIFNVNFNLKKIDFGIDSCYLISLIISSTISFVAFGKAKFFMFRLNSFCFSLSEINSLKTFSNSLSKLGSLIKIAPFLSQISFAFLVSYDA